MKKRFLLALAVILAGAALAWGGATNWGYMKIDPATQKTTLYTAANQNAGYMEYNDRLQRTDVYLDPAVVGGAGASLPDQAGHTGEFLSTDGSAASWGTPAGSGTITGVWACATGNCDALTGAAGDTLDVTLADSSKPFKSGTAASRPATCTEPMTYWATDTDMLYVCTAGNAWTGVYDATILRQADVDDVPVDGVTTAPVSSNWAYDHVAAADPHTGYRLESADVALGTSTSGDYVSGATATGGLTKSGTEGATLGITPCVNENYVQKWNAATGWTCQSDATGAGGVATDAIWDAAGDLVQGTGANTASKLAIGTAGQVLHVNAGATAVEYSTGFTVDADGDVVGKSFSISQGATGGAMDLLEAAAGGTNYRRVSVPDALTANLDLQHADALPAANQFQLYPTPTAGVSQYVWTTYTTVATDALWDAAGDLAQGSGANTGAKLTKGAEGTILRAGASLNAYSTSTFADTYVQGGLLHAATANTVAALVPGAVGSFLMSNGTGAALSYLAAGAANYMLVGAVVTTIPVWTASTGTGAPVLATSPTLVTPKGIVERIGATFDGGGSAIALNTIAYVHVPFAVTTINQWTVLCDADVAGDGMVFSLYMDAYAEDTLPTTTMCATESASPRVANGHNTAQGNWTCSVAAIPADRNIGIKVTDVGAATWCTVSLKVTR